MKQIQQLSATPRKLDAVYQMLFQRVPTEREVAVALQFLGELPGPDRWIELVHGLMMTNEFAFVD
jgi:hypothetical protein